MIPSVIEPLIKNAVHKTVDCIINALTADDMSSLKEKLTTLNTTPDLTLETVTSESKTIINGNVDMSKKFSDILDNCVSQYNIHKSSDGSGPEEATVTLDGKQLNVDLKNLNVEEIKSWTQSIPAEAFTSLKICAGPGLLAGLGAVAANVAENVLSEPGAGILINTALQIIATIIFANNFTQSTMGGRPKKKTRKRKSRKSKRKSRKGKGKGKGRSRKIKRKHR